MTQFSLDFERIESVILTYHEAANLILVVPERLLRATICSVYQDGAVMTTIRVVMDELMWVAAATVSE